MGVRGQVIAVVNENIWLLKNNFTEGCQVILGIWGLLSLS